MSARRTWPLGLGAAALAFAQLAPAATLEEAIGRCRDIEAPTARLACYDAASGRPTTPARGAANGVPAASAPGPAALPPAATTAAPAPATSDFGLPPAQAKPPAVAESLQATISALSADRIGHAVITLDNGQVWYVAEADSHLSVGDKVTIKRAALGSFMLTTADRHGYKVRRTR